MALKLDLTKAYDRMEWSFLRKVLIRFGFAHDWIEMVMQCVSSMRYSFLIRGKLPGYVCLSRGLRQGDPLSPYLFLLGAEGFSALLQRKQVAGLLPGIEDVIETYGQASGQLVNFSKSFVVFSKNVSEEMREEVSSLMGVEVVASHEKYLGLPTYLGRKKTATFQYIKDNLAKKIDGWQGKMLSGEGKDILIQVVAQALPSYAMSVFQLIKNFCEDLDQMCARFWWGTTLDKKKIHWKTWNALCNLREEGGLGFRSLTNFNSAMLAKQAWRVIHYLNSLIVRIYKAKYFPESSFWEASSHASPSFSWRSISSSRDLLKENSCWQIGNGEEVNIWSDCWISGLQAGRLSNNDSAMGEVSKVSDLISATGVWNDALIRRLFDREEAEIILNIPLSHRNILDRLVWKRFWKRIWKVLIPNAAKVFAWRVCHDILPSVERLATRHIQTLSLTELGVLIFLLWSIWKERNSRVWEGKSVLACDVVLRADTRMQEFRVHNTNFALASARRRRVQTWVAPSTGVLKINVDGSFHHNTRSGGFGFVIRDSSGAMLAGGAGPLCGLISSEHAEVLACRNAIRFAIDHGFVPALLETNAQEVQHQLAAQASHNASASGRLYEDLSLLLDPQNILTVSYVSRMAM
ncbi:uncharacterized protein LOC133711437 [Rosa rugosa]|uniref:uncharacterized protein LOC133711437 n=1 Tax=Rosa rugosa TaxID=74645 RepID=UPI002B407767|nr:uncharacterized protein LOC133711437 [Rosa rugosa]